MIEKRLYHTPFGPLALGCEGGQLCLCSWIQIETTKHEEATNALGDDSPEILKQAASQLDEYFSNKRTHFDIPVKLTGTPFQQKVWEALSFIPFGSTVSYAQLAHSVGIPKASRAVAQACHANPIAIIIPCHRVIGANGKLIGYAGGLERKGSLLALEQKVQFCNNGKDILIN